MDTVSSLYSYRYNSSFITADTFLLVLVIIRNFCLKHEFHGDILCSLTDVAALACGREFLVSSSPDLLDTMMHLLGEMKPGLCTKLKVYDDFLFSFT